MTDKQLNPLLRLLKNIRDNDPGIFLICAIYTLIALFVPLFSIALPKLLIGYLTGAAPSLRGILLIVSVFFVLAATFYFFKEWIDNATYSRFTTLRLDYVRDYDVKLLEMDYKYMESATFFDEYETAAQATSNNGSGIEGTYHKLFDLPQLCLLVVVLCVFIGMKSPIILLAIIIHIVTATLVAIFAQRYRYSRKEELSKHERRLGYYMKTSKDFAYGKDVRLYDLKERLLENFKTVVKCYIDVLGAVKNREYLLGFLALPTLLISDLAVYGILTWLTVNGMSIADYSMYVVAASTLSLQMTLLSENFTYMTNEYMYVRDYFSFMDKSFGEPSGDLPAPPKDVPLEIEFLHVNFCYPGTDKKIFNDFSLKIPAGQKLALVGINGAGKTTFVKLLLGLFNPDSGRIILNGHDISEYSKPALFSMFAAVFQDINVFSFTVAQNIACSLENIDYPRVDAVLKQVGLSEKVAGLENGVNTMMLKIIDENGTIFSGGESQRLVIARALYKGGNCVIMDEPTSALDALAEAEIYSEFDTLTKGKTSIYISHRLASTKFCDKIALINGSGLCQYGSHDELMALDGPYHDMFVTQGKYYQEEVAAQ